jgi:hypothetical protein
MDIRFEVFTAVTMKNAVFWDVLPCIPCVNRHFGGIYYLHLQGRKTSELGTRVNRWLQSAATCSHCFLARGLFYPEYGDDTFLRNVGSQKIYMAPHPRIRYSYYYYRCSLVDVVRHRSVLILRKTLFRVRAGND